MASETSDDQPDATSTAAEQATETSQPLSKNAQKRLAKAARFQAQKLGRRAREKEMKKEKKRIRAEKRAAGELEEDEERAEEEKRRAKKRMKHGVQGQAFGAKVVVDLGFDDMMHEKEIVSLCSQLAYTYSANRRASTPFSNVIFTSLNGRTFHRLEDISNASYKRWSNTQWWTEGYEKLWSTSSENARDHPTTPDVNSAPQDAPKVDKEEGTSDKSTPAHSTTAQENVIYLTADSSEELTELKEDETYIIGGICDHNRYKNLCLNKAEASSIRTARLPIGTYLSHLPTRKVLTVNQVFEIMLNWVETRDWEEALYAVIPKRKFQGKDGRKEDEDEDEDGQDGGEGKGKVAKEDGSANADKRTSTKLEDSESTVDVAVLDASTTA